MCREKKERIWIQEKKGIDGRAVGYVRAAKMRTWHFCCLLAHVLVQVGKKLNLFRTDVIQATGRG